MKRAAALLAAAALAACGATQEVSDWERANPEKLDSAATSPTAVNPPPLPRAENLTEIYISATATFRYFVDRSSLAVNYKQREIRYVLLARSPSGVENVSYEAIKCPSLHRIYAVGSDGKWVMRGLDWQPIMRSTAVTVPHVLARQFFCPHRDSIQSVAEGVNALKNGVHPLVYVEQRPGPASR
ncbi:MAG TPA: CNP1-like family protein [Burkholderiales bacterium]